MEKDNSKFDIFVCIFLFILIFLSKLKTLGTPYHWDEISWVDGVYWLSEAKFGLLRFIPGLYPAGTFLGHPPGLQLPLAIIFKILGKSIWVSHLFIVFISFLGVYFTYLLASFLYGRKVGIFSALFLFFSPIYFAQSGMFLGDVPVAALGVMSLYFALRGKYIPYLLCSLYMVLIKETGIFIIFSILIYLFLIQKNKLKYSFKEPVKYSFPLWVIFAFLVVQKFMTGKFCFIVNPEYKLITLHPKLILKVFFAINRWIFYNQYRLIFTLLFILNFILNKNSRRRRELMFFLLILIFSGYILSFFYFLPRYLMPVLPYLFILGTWSLAELTPSKRLNNVAFAGIIAVLICSLLLFGRDFKGNGEFNMSYLDAVKVHRDMCQYIEKEFPSARILAVWPNTQELLCPYFGYVEKPLKVINFSGSVGSGDFDLIFFSIPSAEYKTELKNYALRNNLKLIKEIKSGEIRSEFYGH